MSEPLPCRVPYVDDPSEDSPIRAIFDLARRGGVLIQPHHRALANQPDALSAFLEMSDYVRCHTDLPADLREIAILTTAHVLDSQYEQDAHRPIARALGVSEAKLDAIAAARSTDPSLSETEQTVVAFARSIARDRAVEDDVFSRLESAFGPAQIIDLALVVGWYHLCAAVFDPLRVSLNESRRSGPPAAEA